MPLEDFNDCAEYSEGICWHRRVRLLREVSKKQVLAPQPGIVTSRANGLPFGTFLHAPGFTPNGTHFVNFEPQCASMRAGFASDY